MKKIGWYTLLPAALLGGYTLFNFYMSKTPKSEYKFEYWHLIARVNIVQMH